MAEPVNIVLEGHRLAFMLPAKVGNASIKTAVADALGMTRNRLDAPGKWHTEPKDYLYRKRDEWLIIGFIRHPYARFVSAWREVIRDNGECKRAGFEFLPTMDEVAGRLPEITDGHWRSLTDELVHEGKIVPRGLVRVEKMDTAWRQMRQVVKAHSGLLLGDLPHLNSTGGDERLSGFAKDRISRHYADDFEYFGYRP